MKKLMIASAVFALATPAFAEESKLDMKDVPVVQTELEISGDSGVIDQMSARVLSGQVSPYVIKTDEDVFSSSVTSVLNDDGTIDVHIEFADITKSQDSRERIERYSLSENLEDGEEVSSQFGEYSFTLSVEEV